MAPGAKTTPEDAAAMTNSLGMNADEIAFLVDCLKYPAGGGSISIDIKAVAEARALKNPGSVANRILKMRKKYNLPIGAGGSPLRKGGEMSGDSISPTKARVTKTRGVARSKKPVKKGQSVDDGTMKASDPDDDGAKEDGNTSEDESCENPEVFKIEEKIEEDAVVKPKKEIV